MAHLALVRAVHLILHSVAYEPAAPFLTRCAEMQLQRMHTNDRDADPPGFPQYDACHTFTFQTDDEMPASFDLLEYRHRIIQVRLAVYYKSFFGSFAKRETHVRVVLPMLLARYGRGTPIKQGPADLLIFADEKTDAYLSRLSLRRAQSLFINVGDREIWRLAGGEVLTVASTTMSRRDEIKELALAVNDALNAYIAIHDAIFREAATFKSFLKNMLGLGVSMSRLLEESEGLAPLWDVIHQKIVAFRRSSYSLLSEDERSYFDILSRYVEAVCETVTALVDRQRLLNQGSMGGPHNPMTWEALQHKERIYNESVRRYMTIGQELTAAGPIIFR